MFELEFAEVSFKHGYFVVTMISPEINDKTEEYKLELFESIKDINN